MWLSGSEPGDTGGSVLEGERVNWRLLHGDCLEVLGTLPYASIDACVTDPPYGIGFMGKEWDSFSPMTAQRKAGLRQCGKLPRPKQSNPNLRGRTVNGAVSTSQIEYDYSVNGLREFQRWTEQWAREVFRVLKPGAHAVVCGAPRAYHRMASGIEDAGFEIRDCLAWLFGSGFPKSLNLGEGLGTALKPAHEPIVLARKPFKGTVKGNIEKFGAGALNIDAARIPFLGPDDAAAAAAAAATQRTSHNGLQGTSTFARTGDVQESINGYIGRMGGGRWPANVVIDDLAALVIDEQSGELASGFMPAWTQREGIGYGGGQGNTVTNDTHGDIGGASRFYYVAKPSRKERDYGCGHLQARTAGQCTDRAEGSAGLDNPRAGAGRTSGGRNFHPTVKPVELMRWLVRLVTPINGTVIDPFTGSGTTGMACRYELRSFIGIEREADYIEIARRRIDAVAPLFASEAV